MRDAVVFSGKNQLDFQEVRMNVTRIPEVIARVREAEDAWGEALGESTGDLASFLSLEDERFAVGPRRRLVVAGVVQLGLFDRFARAHGVPEFLGGAERGPVGVAIGARSLAAFVEETARATTIASVTPAWWRRDGETWIRVDELGPIDRTIAIGPGAAGEGLVDSVDLDPALAWFWTSLVGSKVAVAN